MEKSSVEEIRARFDADVERFSRRDTGQTALIDARLSLDMIAEAAAGLRPEARRLLDVGCGAGNFSLALLERLPDCDVDLVDLSLPMLRRAEERVGAATTGTVTIHPADIREQALPEDTYDVIVAASVLHHLRTDAEWETVFAALYASLRPGGVLFVSDMIEHDIDAVQAVMWRRYGEYLENVDGPAYREKVFAYIAREDTPRSLLFQIDLLRNVGFSRTDVLHKNAVFAAFLGIK
ncbi:MAG: methyltransferase domain-containing protein [Bacteroidia bacterium]|nr:methyltransferase domain-containing protein [Bacteroidia bacterium]